MAVTAKAGAAKLNAEKGALWQVMVCVGASVPVAKRSEEAPAAVPRTR